MPTENDAMREAGGPGSRAARYVITFENASKDDFAIIGGKCAGLVALIASGAAVPTGFVVTTNAYADSMAAHHLPDAIARLTGGLTVDDIRGQARAAQEIRDLITARPMSERVAEAIHAGYRALCERAGRELPVAVRSSGTAEDLPEASFAGQGDTYLWTVGADAVIERVRDCWASLFTARAIAYRAKNGYGHVVQQMAVVVQQMVNARSAGVAMSLDPSNGDRSKIVIESTWGLGEPLVSGLVTPDLFPNRQGSARAGQAHDCFEAAGNGCRSGRTRGGDAECGKGPSKYFEPDGRPATRGCECGQSRRKGARYATRHRVGRRCRPTGA